METAPVSALFEDESASRLFGNAFGLLGREKIDIMLQRRMILTRDTIERGQMQPASLDLGLAPKLTVSAPASCRAKARRSPNSYRI